MIMLNAYEHGGIAEVEARGLLEDFMPFEYEAVKKWLHYQSKIVYLESIGKTDTYKYSTLCVKYDKLMEGLGI